MLIIYFTPLASCFCGCRDGKDLCVYSPCVCVVCSSICTLSLCVIVPVDEDSLFPCDVVAPVWMYGYIRAKEQVELQTMHSQQSLSCHWPAATWAASSSAKLFQHTGNWVFTWGNLAPVRDESLIWRLTAPASFKLDGLLTCLNNCLEVEIHFSFCFFHSKLGQKHHYYSDYTNQASV